MIGWILCAVSALAGSPRRGAYLGALLLVASIGAHGAAHAQERYDDRDLEDRFYITLGGFSQTDIRTTIRLDAKTPGGGIAAGTVIALESLFDIEDEVNTARLDGWYRFNRRHRIGWTYFTSKRDGLSTYNGDDTIEVGDTLIIANGDTITTEDDSKIFAVSWSYSFLNTKKYEAWLGAGLNVQDVNTTIEASLSSGARKGSAEARGAVPVPTINFGGRWNFSPRWRMLLRQELFGIRLGDFSGSLDNTRILAEVDLVKGFGIGGGIERFNFEVEAESDDLLGQLDTSYTAFTLYLKGQI